MGILLRRSGTGILPVGAGTARPRALSFNANDIE